MLMLILVAYPSHIVSHQTKLLTNTGPPMDSIILFYPHTHTPAHRTAHIAQTLTLTHTKGIGHECRLHPPCAPLTITICIVGLTFHKKLCKIGTHRHTAPYTVIIWTCVSCFVIVLYPKRLEVTDCVCSFIHLFAINEFLVFGRCFCQHPNKHSCAPNKIW